MKRTRKLRHNLPKAINPVSNFHALQVAIFRQLRQVLNSAYLLIAILVGFFIGYIWGPELAPSVIALTDTTFLGRFSFLNWESICRWVAALSLAAVGWAAYWQHKSITKLRSQHEFTYGLYREIVATPGNRITDVIWAYVTGFILIFVPFGMAFFVGFCLPFLMTQNALLRFFLVAGFSGCMGGVLNGAGRVMKEVLKPHRLEYEVQNSDKLISIIQKKYMQYLAEKERQRRISNRGVNNDDW